MHQTGRFVTEYFSFFSSLGWLDRLIFRYRLKWIADDPCSMEVLLAFERALADQDLDSHSRFQAVTGALFWYNREDHDKRLTDRLPKNQFPAMLQVVFPFLDKSKRLHIKYKELILNILRAGEAVATKPYVRCPLLPSCFNGEAAALIVTLPARWSGWDRWDPSLLLMGKQILAYLEKIAGDVYTAELFTLFRLQIPHLWSTGPGKNLDYLSSMAGRVPNKASFTFLFEQAVPDLGLESATALLGIVQDFEEFEYFFRRTSDQVKIWETSYLSLFRSLPAA